jgi:hypothetical protein
MEKMMSVNKDIRYEPAPISIRTTKRQTACYTCANGFNGAEGLLSNIRPAVEKVVIRINNSTRCYCIECFTRFYRESLLEIVNKLDAYAQLKIDDKKKRQDDRINAVQVPLDENGEPDFWALMEQHKKEEEEEGK